MMEFVVRENGERLDRFLARAVRARSRTKWQRAIACGSVKVNGHFVVKPGFALRSGDRIVVLEEKILSPHAPFSPEPEPDIPLEIVYEDKDIAVVNKPAGLLVHPTLTRPKHTLANALIARYPEIKEVGESPLRPGLVHRLDKDTSGLLVVAKHQAAFLYMKEQFLKRQVKKTYLALVEGVPARREGVIEYAIRPSKHNRLKKVAVKREADMGKKSVRAARTRYQLKETFGNSFALLEVSPETGRTHQIRVHLASIGHPVAGDRTYGSRSRIAKRQFLHAAGLRFTAPSGTPLALECDLPPDLLEALRSIKDPRG